MRPCLWIATCSPVWPPRSTARCSPVWPLLWIRRRQPCGWPTPVADWLLAVLLVVCGLQRPMVSNRGVVKPPTQQPTLPLLFPALLLCGLQVRLTCRKSEDPPTSGYFLRRLVHVMSVHPTVSAVEQRAEPGVDRTHPQRGPVARDRCRPKRACCKAEGNQQTPTSALRARCALQL